MSTADLNHGLSVQHADALWDAVAIPGPERPTFPRQHERVCRAVAEIVKEAEYATPPEVQAAILREAADRIDGTKDGLPVAVRNGVTWATAELRRSAAALAQMPNDPEPVVAYRAPGLDVLYCVQCRPSDARFVAVGSTDLPDGGICENCDTDVLIRVKPSPCPRCGEDVSTYTLDDLVYRTGDDRPYCSGECVVAMHRASEAKAELADADLIEAAREIGLVEPEKAPEIIAAARELMAQSGVDTPGCDCGHEGMGPAWHLKACMWLKTLNVPHPDTATAKKPEAEVRCGGCGHREGEGCGCPPSVSGIRGLLEHVGIDTTGKDIRVGNRVVDAWPHSCEYHAMRCNLARIRQEHPQHDWEPQPGMTPLHCQGWNAWEASGSE
ncbi:hypothetical protein ACFW2V_13205 [Streptomyces sp. NPDC058947]|uniref:hypothetical protein n=1 Tax=Streptomyces sp. NPDC058947 TaxID=3346675 RepID=UPI0036D02909